MNGLHLQSKYHRNLFFLMREKSFADVLSVLAVTYSDDKTLNSLKYRLFSPHPTVTDWSHEYVRHLASEIGLAYNKRTETYSRNLQTISSISPNSSSLSSSCTELHPLPVTVRVGQAVDTVGKSGSVQDH